MGWTLFHLKSPLNTSGGGTGLVRELTEASSRSMHYSVQDTCELTFTLPGNSIQTAEIRPLVDDVLAFRDDKGVQRFRVVSRVLAKADGVTTANFTAVGYRALPDGWIVHDMGSSAANKGHRSWPAASMTAAQREQSLIAWTLFNDGQVLPNGNLGVSRGHVPTTAVARDLTGTTELYQPVEYFAEGLKRGDAINQLAAMDHGFEWDVDVDPSDPFRKLLFDVWATDDGGRNQFGAGRSTLVLDDGGAVASWSHTTTPAEYGNVGRFTGSADTSSNVYGAASVPVWVPASKNPDTTAPPTGTWQGEGRWEQDVNNGDWTMQVNVTQAAPTEFTKMNKYVPELTVDLARGRWTGPDQLWLGDKARCIITEPVRAPEDSGITGWILYIDEDVRVVEISVSVDDEGAEDVSLSLNRPKFSSVADGQVITQRLARLERR